MTDPAEIARIDDAAYRAAIKWCGEKERETFPEDVEYFLCNWRAFPGFKARVDAEIAILKGTDHA